PPSAEVRRVMKTWRLTVLRSGACCRARPRNFKLHDYRVRREKCFSMASTRPRMVDSRASKVAGKPRLRRVAEVTGPIEPMAARWRNISRLWLVSKRTRCAAVEELVKVKASGGGSSKDSSSPGAKLAGTVS